MCVCVCRLVGATSDSSNSTAGVDDVLASDGLAAAYSILAVVALVRGIGTRPKLYGAGARWDDGMGTHHRTCMYIYGAGGWVFERDERYNNEKKKKKKQTDVCVCVCVCVYNCRFK